MTILDVDANQLGQLAVLAVLLERRRRGSWGGELQAHTGMPRTSVAAFLRRLEEVGWAESFEDTPAGHGAPRKVYRLSPTGVAAAGRLVRDAADAAAIVVRVAGTLS